MATRWGAEALYMGDITGSLEPGKRADVIVVDHSPLHNVPHFERDDNSVYSQLVYASSASDVRHVMVNGRWLMRDRELLTVDEAALRREAEEVARKIDRFLIAREGNILNKLIAIGGLQQEESFEIQVKAVVTQDDLIDRLLADPAVQLVKHNHYRQYDTYFLFDTEDQGRVRYREDDFIDEHGNVTASSATPDVYHP